MSNITFGRLTDLVNNVKAFQQREAFSFVFSISDNQARVIELNTDEQLFEGIDATGIDLRQIGGDYAESTVIRKLQEGLPADRVTLFQEGDFYNSFRVSVQADGFTIEANTVKNNEIDLRDRWGEELLGLTDDSINDIIEFIAQDLINRILHELLR